MDARRGVARAVICLRVPLKTLRDGHLFQSGKIVDLDNLLVVGKVIVVLLENRLDAGQEIGSLRKNRLVQRDQLTVVDLNVGGVVLPALEHLLEQRIPLADKFLIVNQNVEVLFVELRNDHIEELSSQFAALVDEVAVNRRNHNERVLPDVVAQALVLLRVQLHHLASVALENAADFAGSAVIVADIFAMDGKKIAVEADALMVVRRKITFAEREVMDGIQQIGLPAAVFTNHGVHLLCEIHRGFRVVLEVDQLYVLEKQLVLVRS